MATAQPAGLPSLDPDLDLGDVLSWLAGQLGIDWGLLVGLVLPLLVVVVASLAGTVWLWRRYSRSPSRSTGTDVFLDQVVTVRSADGMHGQVFVEGSWWSVRSTAELHTGQDVRVHDVDRLELLVEPLDPPQGKEES